MSSTYANSPVRLVASTRELIKQTSENMVEANAEGGHTEVGFQAQGLEVAAEEEEIEAEELYDWVSTKICNTAPNLKSDKPVSFYEKYVIAPAEQRWKLILANDLPACTKHNGVGFFFYRASLETMGVRIPPSNFQKDVLNYLHVAPSQLHPNGWGFIRGFEMVMERLGRVPTARVFFYFFNVFHSSEPGSGGKRQGHVGLQRNT